MSSYLAADAKTSARIFPPPAFDADILEAERQARHQFAHAQAAVRALLNSPALDEVARTAFGAGIGAEQLATAIRDLDRHGWPELRLAELRGARGAYVAAIDAVFLCPRFVDQGASRTVQDVLLHEIGHAIDHRLGGPEAPGDEGAIFAALLAGEMLSPAGLAALRNADDTGILVIDGQRLTAEFANSYGRITVDGSFSDWTAADRIDTSANTVTGYALYGTFTANTFLIGIQSTSSSDLTVGPGTTIWLNTDGNRTTGYNLPWGFTNVGAEYNVTFDSTGTPYLYTGAAGQTPVSATPLDFALSADGKSLEIALPQSLLTPSGGATPTSIGVAAIIDNSVYLPGDYSTSVPEYTISQPAPVQTYGTITIDGNLSDWTAAQEIDTAGNAVTGYTLYGTVAASTYLIAVQSTSSSDPVIGLGTTIWLNTDENRTTGYNLPWGFTNVGAEYNVTFDSTGTPYLYTGAAGQTPVSATPLNYALSADGKSLEIAIPKSLVTPSGGTAPGSINMAAVINNSIYLPGNYATTTPEYTINDPSVHTPKTYGWITVDGSLTDWTPAARIDTAANAVTGYALYGTIAASTYLMAIQATSSSDQVIGAGTTIWLNIDGNRTTGYNLAWGFTNVGAEYNITFDSTGMPYLYTGAAGQTLVSTTPLDFALSPNGESLEIAIPESLITPAGGTPPSSISVAAVIDNVGGNAPNAVYLPGDYSTVVPEYTVTAPTYGSIGIDGNFGDWTAAQRIDELPGDAVTGYALYGTVAGSNYLIGMQATSSTDPAIGPGSTIWLNTDLNSATGTSLWGGTNVGAEYNITFDSTGTPYLYTGTAGQTLVSTTPLTYAFSSDGKSLEIAIPESLLTPTGGTAPTSIDMAANISAAGLPTSITYLPGDFTNDPQYQITDPASLPPKVEQHKVAIVYSDTTANLYFNQTAYSDLFMAVQNQARMAGISYDIIDESKLTNVANLVGYDALIFPDMADVNTAQLPAIMSTLTDAVYHYGISIISAGDFLTNDQNGATLAGNAYANMTALTNLQRVAGGNSGTVSITASDVSNPIMQGFTSGQVIQNYTNEGYTDYEGVTAPADVLVNQNVSGVGTMPGVVETTTGNKNVEFATQDLMGDSNLLSHVIQSVVLGTQPGVALHTSRHAGIVSMRMDMDQSQYPSDVSPVSDNGTAEPGIYDKLIPILQQWKTQYDFVGSYYINIGNTPTSTTDQTDTDWTKSLAYYQDIEALGGEIGNHSYTHLVNPPTTTITETTVGDTPAGSTTINLSGVPSFAGSTLNLVVSGPGLGANVTLPGVAGEAGAIANTTITAISGNTITINFQPGGYGTGDEGTLADIPAGTTLTFSVSQENTNFLQTTGTVQSAAGAPFTYDYEFNQSKALEESELGHTIYGAAVPGAPETLTTSEDIQQYYTSTSTYTGYLSGGWTGIGAGYPSAFGYMTPTDTSSVYIAPNMTFDFTEIQYEGKTVAQTEADWASQMSALTADSAGTPILVWPIHDYGASAWDTSDSGETSPYSTQMFTDVIAQASADNYEFVTEEELASRIAAQEKASVNYTTSGNTITATVTPDPSAPDLGAMALSVINGGSEVIQNAGSWYAYNAQEIFVPRSGGSFTVNLGTTQDDVTHIANLPERADLLNVTGDGTNLNFSMTGDGGVLIDVKNPATSFVSIQGAPTASLTGNALTLTFADTLVAPTYTPTQHNVSVEDSAAEFLTASNDIVFGTTGSDTFHPAGGGTDTYYGNGGTDTMVFSGPSPDYAVTVNADGSTTYRDLRAGSPDGTATLYNISTLQFALTPTPTMVVASGTGISNGAGTVAVGTVVTLTVTFNEAVTVAGGTPTLTLNDGGVATYSSGSGTNALVFTYTVAAGQTTPDLAVSGFNLPTGTTILDATGAPAAFGTAPALSGVVAVAGLVPTIASIAASGTGITNGAGTVGVGTAVTLAVTFNEAVTVAGGTPTLTLNDGGTATYSSGSGTSALVFTYTVAAGQSTAGLAVSAVNLPTGTTLKDAGGNAAALGTVPALSGTVAVNGLVPTIASITTSGTGITGGAGIIGVGKTVAFTVTLNEAVTVAGGTPTLTLNDGGTASYASGSGTAALTFNYTVAAGQSTADLAVSSFNLPTGVTVRDAAGNAANLAAATNYNPAGTLQVDTTAPTVSSVATSGTGITGGTGIVGVGKVVSFTVTFSEAVTVAGGTPTLTLNDGGTASYASGSGTTALTFNYTVAAGQSTADLAVSATALNGATITDAAGNAAVLTGAAVNPAGTLQVITTAPTISTIATSGTGITSGTGVVGVGKVVAFTVTFSEAVTVAGGTPTLTLNDGGTASYASGSGTAALTFNYTVAAGQSTADLAVSSFNLPTGVTVRDAAGNAANLAAATNYNPAGTLQVITTAPTISTMATSGTGITSGTGDLNAGKAVTFAVTMSTTVTVASGTPSLGLNDGGTATYTGGSGTNTLTFSYTVAAGQNTSDLTVSSMALNGATIKDGGGNSFVPPATFSNPAGTLQIDTTAPTIAISSVAGTNTVTGTTAAGGFHITGTTGGTGGVENGQAVTVKLLNASQQVAATVTGTVSSNSWSAAVTSAQATALTDGSYTAVASVSDKAGNAGTSSALGFTVNEARVPTLTLASGAVTVNAGGSVSLGITASSTNHNDRESVTIKGVPSYEKIAAPTGYTVSSSAVTGSTYNWTVTEATAGTPLTGLAVSSSYTGTGHPVASFTVTATSTQTGQTATSASKTLTVTDPPAATTPITAAQVASTSLQFVDSAASTTGVGSTSALGSSIPTLASALATLTAPAATTSASAGASLPTQTPAAPAGIVPTLLQSIQNAGIVIPSGSLG